MEKFTLRTARDRAGLNLKDAAEMLGVNKDTLANYESGNTYPKAPEILKMLEIYDVKFEQLIFLQTNHG